MRRKATIDLEQTHLRFSHPGNLRLIVSRCLPLDFDRAALKFPCGTTRNGAKNLAVRPRVLASGWAARFRFAPFGTCALALFLLSATGCRKPPPEDEAKLAGLTPNDFPQITADIFQPMDGGIELAPDEIMGRNTWNLWSGGNQHFWNHVAQDSFGLMDLLKMLDNRKYPARRALQDTRTGQRARLPRRDQAG